MKSALKISASQVVENMEKNARTTKNASPYLQQKVESASHLANKTTTATMTNSVLMKSAKSAAERWM